MGLKLGTVEEVFIRCDGDNGCILGPKLRLCGSINLIDVELGQAFGKGNTKIRGKPKGKVSDRDPHPLLWCCEAKRKTADEIAAGEIKFLLADSRCCHGLKHSHHKGQCICASLGGWREIDTKRPRAAGSIDVTTDVIRPASLRADFLYEPRGKHPAQDGFGNG